jgi:hypothetical protein
MRVERSPGEKEVGLRRMSVSGVPLWDLIKAMILQHKVAELDEG